MPALIENRSDIFVMKVNDAGGIVWKQRLGGSYGDVAYAVDVNSFGEIFVTGVSNSPEYNAQCSPFATTMPLVIKMSDSGNVLWRRCFGGTESNDNTQISDRATSIVASKDGGAVVIGYANSTDGDFAGLSHGSTDIFAVKYDSSGKQIWKRMYGGLTDDPGPSGTYVMEPYFPLYAKACRTNDNCIAIASSTYSDGLNSGTFATTQQNGTEALLFVIDSVGELKWYRTLGGWFIDFAYDVACDRDGSLVISGRVQSDDGDFANMNKSTNINYSDVLVAKYSESGALLWKKLFGGGGHEYGASIAIDDSSNIMVVGCTSSTDYDFKDSVRGKADMFIMGLASSGKLKWKRRLGGFGDEEFYSLVPAGNNSFIAAGITQSIDGEFEEYPAQLSDIVLAKIDSNGSWLPVTTSTPEPGVDNEFSVRAYPNPFSVSTDIVVETSLMGPLSLCIVDAMGNLLEPLHTGIIEGGVGRFRLVATELASQVYYLVVRNGLDARVVPLMHIK
jgi:hypothetical protein